MQFSLLTLLSKINTQVHVLAVGARFVWHKVNVKNFPTVCLLILVDRFENYLIKEINWRKEYPQWDVKGVIVFILLANGGYRDFNTSNSRYINLPLFWFDWSPNIPVLIVWLESAVEGLLFIDAIVVTAVWNTRYVYM